MKLFNFRFCLASKEDMNSLIEKNSTNFYLAENKSMNWLCTKQTMQGGAVWHCRAVVQAHHFFCVKKEVFCVFSKETQLRDAVCLALLDKAKKSCDPCFVLPSLICNQWLLLHFPFFPHKLENLCQALIGLMAMLLSTTLICKLAQWEQLRFVEVCQLGPKVSVYSIPKERFELP